jgi:hypothetical protein
VTSQVYAVRGTFNGGTPEDGLTGRIMLETPTPGETRPPRGWAVNLTFALAGHRGKLAPYVLDDVRITPAGAISFKIGGAGIPFVFTGFLSGETITGSYRMERPGKKALTGSWEAVPVQVSQR